MGSLPIRISKIEEIHEEDKKNMNFVSSEEFDEADELEESDSKNK